MPNTASCKRDFSPALCLLLLLFAGIASAQPPYRFLLVISDQWKDPASYIVEDAGDFQILAALLKSWGLPFDVLRLDQQRLDEYHLLDRDGRPRYSTIIWDTGPGEFRNKGLNVASDWVRRYGAGMVVIGDSVAVPEIAALAGVRYVSEFDSPDTLALRSPHFITRGLHGREKGFTPPGKYLPGNKAVAQEASVLLTRGPHPFLTAKGRVVWLGATRSAAQLQKQVVRDLLKRSLVWANDYALYAEYPQTIILFMDDMGTSDKTFLSYWSYLSPTEETIRKGLIGPLKRYKAVLAQDVNTGFVDKKSRRVLNAWKQDRVLDALVPGRIHDFASTKRGLEAGLREGVFEIQSQGWTHMLPDLESPPGPWWDAPMDGTGSLPWWTEFGDPIRKKEIPAIVQEFHMRRSLEQIRDDFGVTPLFLIRGGGGFSRSDANHTARIAAQMGFGLSELGGDEYLGRDFVIDLKPVLPRGGWAHDQTISPRDIPWTIDAPYYLVFHDRDLSVDPTSPERLLRSLGPQTRYMSANEYCAYLHAKVSRYNGALAVEYDDHYCRYFQSHESTWILHRSDGTPERRTIRISSGLGRHTVNTSPNSPARVGRT